MAKMERGNLVEVGGIIKERVGVNAEEEEEGELWLPEVGGEPGSG